MGLPKDFVVTVLIVKENSVLLVRHRKLGLWLPIGGHIDDGEHPEEALEREIQEECGLEVDLVAERFEEVNWKEVKAMPIPFQVQVEHIDGKHEHVDLIYAAKWISGEAKLADKEHQDIRWFSLDEIEGDNSGHISPDIKFLAKKAVEIVKQGRG
tara:strand:- start:2851 stop:3315 length:465 start_codon:yes stop_codon:yes gene_type:complete